IRDWSVTGVQTCALPILNEFVLPTWVNSNFAKNYVISDISGQTLAQLAQSSIVDPVLQSITEDGNPAKEERQWRANFNTSYNFRSEERRVGKECRDRETA